MAVKNLTAEGDPPKRYRIVYWGEIVVEHENAKDALDKYHRHYREVRPGVDKNPKAKKDRPFYTFFDGRKEIDLATLKRAAKAESDAAERPQPIERPCPACKGTGVEMAKQPRRPGVRVYPPQCKECLGKGRVAD
jgi:DnaJ-class molecular chaperone